MSQLKRVCRYCGREYDRSEGGGTLYCSPECAKAGRNKVRRDKRRALEWVERECLWCGKVYTPTDRQHLLCCSDECRADRHRAQIRQHNHERRAKSWESRHQGGDYEQHLIDRKIAHELKEEKKKGRPPKSAQPAEPEPVTSRKLSETLTELREQGISYSDWQRKNTIERYARINLGEGDRQ